MAHAVRLIEGKRKYSHDRSGSSLTRIETGNAAVEDEIRPEMLYALNVERVRWLTRMKT